MHLSQEYEESICLCDILKTICKKLFLIIAGFLHGNKDYAGGGGVGGVLHLI